MCLRVRVCASLCVRAWRREDEEGGKGCLCSQLYICSHGNQILLMDVIFSILSFPLCPCFEVCVLRLCVIHVNDRLMSFTSEI